MNKQNLIGALAAPLILWALAVPSYADSTATTTTATTTAAVKTTCKDGSMSDTSGRGACSGHGGVQKAPKSTTAAAASTPAAPAAAAPASTTAAKSTTAAATAPAAGNTDPTGATAKCKDGTYSKAAHRTGACSKHGGVDTWMGATK